MNKTFLTLMAALTLSGSAIAAPVDATSAKEKAAAFLKKQAQHSTNSRRAAALRNPQLTEAQAFGNALHVFNVGGDNGFVIVSGDDRTEEILGYVDGGTFDYNNIPDNMRFWLQMYADQINSLGNSKVQKAPRRTDRADVAPTCATQWDQIDPFNNYILDDIPEQDQYYHDQLMTGCVATSMAQAIYTAASNYKAKHGNWPAIPTNTIPAYTNSESGTTTYSVSFPELPEFTFDWANMRTDNYSSLLYSDITEDQIKAVGKLMQYCGRAMQMEYDKVNSASVFVWAGRRMHENLGLSLYCQSVDRGYYTSEDWEDMMYKEVSEGRAVCYSANVGQATSSEGHAFILDGYQASTGLWHINWGWGKSVTDFGGHPKADGYFSLSVMQPMAAGSGSASVLEAQYKYLQQAIINVSYDDPEDAVNALNFYWSGKNVYTSSIGGWGTYNVLSGTVAYEEGWAIRHADGTISDNIWNKTTTHEYASIATNAGETSYFRDMTIPTEDGEYDIVHISREQGTDTWYPSYGTEKNYVTVTVSGGSITKAVAHPVDPSTSTLSVAGIDFVGDMEANQNNTVVVTVNNTGDDIFGTLAMYYSTGTSVESTKKYEQLATIKPGETTHEFTVNLPKGEYKLWFFVNPSSYPSASNAFGTGKMFIGYGADANKVQAGNLKFDGQTGTTLNAKSVNGQLEEMTGTFDVTNNTGHTFSSTYYINVEYTETSYYGSGTTTVYATTEVPFEVEAGTSSVPFNLGTVTGLISGKKYTVRLYSKSGDAEVNIASKEMELASYFRYWKADGTVVESPEGYYDSNSWSSVYMPDATGRSEAVAMDLRGVKTDYLKKATNPNCVYYMTASQKPSSSYSEFYSTNNIIDGVAESMTINADYAFFAPEAFTAEEISFSKTFENGIVKDGNPYWYTIVLPFEVNSVKQGTKNLKWFKKASDKRCHFWLMELTDVADNTLTFDYAQKFEANTPYIIQVPSTGWGDSWNLAGKELTFRGLNVTVPATAFAADAIFVGTYAPLTTSGLFLDATVNKFVFSENGSVAPYNAYINAPSNANAMRIVIAGDEIATGIGQVTIDNDQDLYDLQGRRVQHAQKGLYIQNGKVVVIK